MAGGSYKSEIKHRMTRRLANWDYCQRAIYSIVITLKDRSRDWLGWLAKNGEPRNPLAKNGKAQDQLAKNGEPQSPLAKNGEPQDQLVKDGEPQGQASCLASPSEWVINPTPFGEALLETLDEMPRLCPQVKILARQLMPEHFHFVVYVTAPLPKPLGQLIRGFKAGAAKRWKSSARNDGPQTQVGFVAGHSCPAIPEWAEGFQDTVLLREGQLEAMIRYVRDNPRRLAEKRANPALFRQVADLALPLDGGRLIGHFSAVGNRHLLERPLVQVQCSRRHFAYRRLPKPGGGLKIARDAAGVPIIESAAPDYAEIRGDVFAAAAHGAVVISPCISDGERQIAREALDRGLPLVVLRNKGFAPLHKPEGRYFDACSAGRILMLAPAAWPYTPQEKAMTRFDATALNRLAQWFVGEDAAEINYHGMTPADIDRLAEEAVQARRNR